MSPLNRKTRTKRQTPARPRPATPILVVASDVLSKTLTLTFDQPVSLCGVPAFTTDVPDATPVSAARVAANSVAITFSDVVDGATRLNVGFQDPAVRNASGGYVTSNTVAL